MADGSSLSKREREIAALVAEGLTDRAIAQRLFISGRTAESHVRHILDKLGFDNRAQIASWTARTERGRDREQAPEETATAPGDLPVQVTSFVGRGSELDHPGRGLLTSAFWPLGEEGVPRKTDRGSLDTGPGPLTSSSRRHPVQEAEAWDSNRFSGRGWWPA